MDRTRTISSNQSGRETQDSGSEHIKKHTRDQMICKLVIGRLFAQSIILSLLMGVVASRVPWFIAMLIGLFCGLVCVMLGMSMRWLIDYKTEEKKIAMMPVHEHEKKCVQFALESAHAVAGNVADRIIAKYGQHLTDQAYVKSVVEETSKIISEELQELKDTLDEATAGLI